jgi:transcriptional regulator GlxA family with amidase domain
MFMGERREKEFLNANLYGDVSLASVAAECNLSVGNFATFFWRTFGRPPHRWLMERRIDVVKGLQLTSRLTLAEIASKCGFADHSALNRSLKRVLGEFGRVAQEQKSIIEQFPPRLTVPNTSTIRMHIKSAEDERCIDS